MTPRWRALWLLLLCLSSLTGTAAAASDPSQPEQPSPFVTKLNDVLNSSLRQVNEVVAQVIFFNVAGDAFEAPVYENAKPAVLPDGTPKTKTVEVPFIVALLAAGGIFFSLYYGLVNVRGFRHAIDVVRGKYDREDDVGEISHFRALTSALSATVGLGNIAGVAIAIQLGGPGAVFWMVITAFFGMATKFSSCTLAQLYRAKNPDGSMSGGPMYYIDLGLRARGGAFAKVGKVIAVMYAFMIMGGAMGGGNMFQSNQAFEAMSTAFDIPARHSITFGLVMAALVGLVILGGIRRIGAATSRIVPAMVAIYVVASVVILVTHFDAIPAAFGLIVERAFSNNAMFGGVVGVLV